MNEYKRIFVIVLDSLGIGAMPDSKKFGEAIRRNNGGKNPILGF